MILDTRYHTFETPEPVRTQLREALSEIDAENYAEAERILERSLSEHSSESQTPDLKVFPTLSIYLAIARARGKDTEAGAEVIRDAIDTIAKVAPEDRAQRPRLIGVLLWLLEDDSGDIQQALEIAGKAVEQFVDTTDDGEPPTNLYLEDVHLIYGELLLKDGQSTRAQEVLSRVTARAEHAFRHNRPFAAASEEGKWMSYTLWAIIQDAKKLIAKAESAQ
ncbi:MAG: hypothetical protein AAGG11_13350 [Pseudomonadota bacterium]